MDSTGRSTRRRRSGTPLWGQLLFSAVESRAQAVAIRFAPASDPASMQSATYQQLDEESSRLARELISHHIGPGDVVAVAIARSYESVVSVWAVAKTGAAYVPVDPAYPVERSAHLTTDSGAVLGLTTATHRSALSDAVPWLVLDDPALRQQVAHRPAYPVSYADRVRPLTPQHPAYVIYTSGSTGAPKGVVVTHAGLGALAASLRDRYEIEPGSRVTHLSSPSFDFAVLEQLLTFSAGATLVVAPPGVFGGAQLLELLRRESVTHLMITPGALESADAADLPALRMVIAGGEALNPELVGRWTHNGRRFFNAYGPTEATVVATATDSLTYDQSPSIGTPLPGMGVLILDTRLRHVAPGVVGELYLAGNALAQGYLRQPALTAARFVANPFTSGSARLYRTGDLARRKNADGPIEYLGRSDFQVKIRGFRIELGEIDTVLAAHPDIDFAHTMGRQLPSGATALVSYVLPRPQVSVDTGALADFLAVSLPGYMIPAAILVLDELPLTPVGKIDRTRLPEPALSLRPFRAPATAVQELIAEVFATVLLRDSSGQRPEVGLDDDFFALGGDSLLAAAAAAKIGAALQVRVPVQQVFEYSTVAALAARVEHDTTASPDVHLPDTLPDRIPLSYPQQRMWFQNRFDPATAVDHIPLAVRLSGPLDLAALQAALGDLVARHQTLRTSYPEIDGVGYQLVLPEADPRATPTIELVAGNEPNLLSALTEFAQQGFDVTRAPPIRLRVMRLAPTEHVLVWVMHHIAADGFSLQPLMLDIMTAYHARSVGQPPAWLPPALQYAQYTMMQRNMLGDEDDPDSLLAQQLAFWRQQLGDGPQYLDLPADHPRPLVASHRGEAVGFAVDAQTHAGLARQAHHHNSTLFMVVHAALAVLLARLSGTRDIVIGTPFDGRAMDTRLYDLIGMFVNTVALRVRVQPDTTFTQLLQSVRRTDIAAFGNADVPFDRLVQLLAPTRSASYHPLFQVMLSAQTIPVPPSNLPELTITPLEAPVSQAKFDLQVRLMERYGPEARPQGITVSITYATDLFDAATVRGFAAAFERILTTITANADVVVGDIDLLAPAQRQHMLQLSQSTQQTDPDATLASQFAASAARNTTAVAVTCEDTRLRYGDFAARVNQLARYLIERGVGPESLVALRIPRSIDFLLGVYAVITAGGAYVPLDPEQPATRTDYMVRTAQVCLVLTTSSEPVNTEVLATEDRAGRVVVLDRLDVSHYAPQPVTDADRHQPLRPANTAYVLFTSGSTGRPKGVAVSHAAIVHRLLWMRSAYGLGAHDVVLQKTPTVFDISVWELFGPLQVGAHLVVARPDGHRDPDYLAQTIAEHRVTVVQFVPSLLAMVVAQHCAPALQQAQLRHVLVGGEALPAALAQRTREFTGAQVHNVYGPTETTVDITDHEVDDNDTVSVPIGAPVWNTRLYVLDERLHPVAAGITGELYVAGAQVARGYVAQQGLSARLFVADPFHGPGQRMYRTGDLVRWRACSDSRASELEYVGRNDFQVKLRGQRVELGEIEAVLAAQPGVERAAAALAATRNGDRLVGYVVADPDTPVDPTTIRSAAREFLAAYMVPDAVIVLDQFPTTASGKLDRRALPQPELVSDTAFRAPTSPVEHAVADAFAAVLDTANVGLDDDFFTLGGNSLSAVRVIAALNAAFGTELNVRELFMAPTVAALAAHVVPGSGSRRRPLTAMPRPVDAPIPLSLAQHRMWLINQLDPRSPAYTIPLALRMTGALDVAALQQAVTDVLTRHETLRTRYPTHGPNDEPYQEILSAEDALPGGLPVRTSADPSHDVAALLAAGFDVASEIPVRAVLLRVRDQPVHVLALAVHHIATDGASLAPLARDLASAYVARSSDHDPQWPPLPVQYADFTLWQRETVGTPDDPDSAAAAQLRYWKKQLAGLSPHPLLVPDRTPTHELPSATVDFVVPAKIHAQLLEQAGHHGASVFMVVHAALAVALARQSGRRDILVATPIAGRGELALDELVGMFVNTLILRTPVDLSDRFAAVVTSTRDTDLAAFAHADIPFEQVAEEVAAAAGSQQLLQVMLSFQNTTRPSLPLPGITLESLDLPAPQALFDLQVIVEPQVVDARPAELVVRLRYATELFTEATMQTLARRFEHILAAVAQDPQVVVGAIDLGDLPEQSPAATTPALAASAARPRPPDARTRGARVTTLPQLLATAVEADPYATAVVFADADRTVGQLSYAELDTQSTRLARLLIDRGVGPEDVVAIAIPRSLDSVLAVWAVAKTGAAFVPVDPRYPAERVRHMVEDAHVVLGLTTAAVRADLPDTALAGTALPDAALPDAALPHTALPNTVPWLSVDDEAALAKYPADPVTYADRLRLLRAEHPAYVIYTSGSTGQPKGVVVTQAGLSGFCDEQRERYRLDSSCRTLHFASPSFDAAVLELLLAVGGGATMVVAAPTVYGGAELAALLARERVTHAFITPSALASVDPRGLDQLRVIIAGGEACPPELVRRWVPPTGTLEFFNGYGPTETTIMTNISAPLVPGEPANIGGPIRGITEYLLNEQLAAVTAGAVGELYITGAQLARGYHARPALTAARFVANPFQSGSRMYRTGDLVRAQLAASGPTGDLQYLGRNDFQVKIRGFRIELGEIDATLTAHPTVSFAVTVGHTARNGATVLVSYVLAEAQTHVDTEALAKFLAERLPGHMVPSAIMVLDEVPLTPVGKLDRDALPAPSFGSAEYREPSTDTERVVAAAFAELFEVPSVGADDDFFALGGDSLSAVRAATRIRAALGVRFPARLLFEASTVATLAARIAEVAATDRPVLATRTDDGPIPLAPVQQRMWLLNQFDVESAAYNVPFAIQLTGDLDVPALVAALGEVLQRHQVLRTRYPQAGTAVTQEILPATVSRVPVIPVSDDTALRVHITQSVRAGFDVTREVPFRISLLRLTTAETPTHVLVFVAHHIAMDGWSLGPLTRDLVAAYVAHRSGQPPQLPPLPVQYADFAVWQHELLGEQSDPTSLLARQLAFWRHRLARLPEALALPTDRPRPPAPSGVGRTHAATIPVAVHSALAELARATDTTLFTVMHAALAAVLARCSGSSDITIGTPIAGRGEPELAELVGMFVNTVVLRTAVDGAAPFSALVASARDGDREAFAHADVPFEQLVEVVAPERSAAHHPLFQVALFFQNLDTGAPLQLPGCSVAELDFDLQVAKFDLQVTVSPRTDQPWTIHFTYATDLFDKSTISAFAGRLLRLLTAVAENPLIAVGDIDVLDATERQMLPAFAGTTHPIAAETVVDGYRRMVGAHPDSPAVTDATGTVTYREFDARVNRLARYLRQLDVGPESIVALALPRSIDLVVGMYAVLTAGGAFLPINPNDPPARIDYLLDTARPAVIVGSDEVKDAGGATVVRLASLELSEYSDAPLIARGLHLDNPAYVLFTSGSTGRPKAVVVGHRAIHNQMQWFCTHYALSSADVYLQKTATTFDVSLWGYFAPLQSGAHLVLAPPDAQRDPAFVAKLIATHRVTLTDFVPSVFQVFLAAASADDVQSLRDVFVIGEALPPRTVVAAASVSHARVHNLYGPTETAVSVTAAPARPGDASVPIGLPQWNTRTYVLDTRLHPTPFGVIGELYVGGEQLARGYLRRPELTADRFVADPYGPPGARMYRTGDVVRRRRDGVLEFVGRSDFQAKVRGHRVEPGEVEAALLALPGIGQAVALASDDRLVAYVTGTAEPEAIRGQLAEVLPSYLVPSVVMVLAALPLTSSGKLDRAALPTPVVPARVVVAPATPTEHAVAAAFTEVLGVDGVGAEDDFFDIGGTSLSTFSLQGALRARLGVDLPMATLFTAATVRALADRIDQGGTETGATVLAEDAELGADFRLGAEALAPADRLSDVLLTGATGFVGVHLLRELLTATQARVWCLVRADNAEAARQRVRDAMAAYRISDTGPDERIIAVPGDLAAPRLGLSEADHARLTQHIDMIVHNGARVNHVEPYARLRVANVAATRELLQLAVTHHIKPFHFVSTANTVIPAAPGSDFRGAESDHLRPDEVAPNGYVASKWVAEQLVWQAGERGLPVSVYRPGTVSGDPHTGVNNPDDAFWTMIAAAAQLGAAPEFDSAAVNLVPVSYVARAVVALATTSWPPEQAPAHAYHLVNHRPLLVATVFERLRAHGVHIDTVTGEALAARLAQQTSRNDTIARALALGNTVGANPITLDDTATRTALAGLGIHCPPIDTPTLDAYITTTILPTSKPEKSTTPQTYPQIEKLG